MSEKKPEKGEANQEMNPIKKFITYTSSSTFSFTGLDVVVLTFAMGFGFSFGVVSGAHASNWMWSLGKE